jgi:hypothetical protein
VKSVSSPKLLAQARSGPVTVLAVAQLKTQLKELLRAACVLRDSRRYRVVFYLDTEPSKLREELQAECEAKNFEVVAPPENGEGEVDLSKFTWKRRSRIWFYSRIVSLLFDRSIKGELARRFFGLRQLPADTYLEASTFGQCWRNELINSCKIDWLISQHEPGLVLVGEDGVGGNAAISPIAKEHGIRTLVVPYEFSTLKQILQAVGSRFPFRPDSPFDRILADNYPRWLYTDPVGNAFFRLPAVIALARELQNQSIRNPWTVHGGYADRIAVESAEMRRHYISEGIPAKKLRDTGALATDDIYEAMMSVPARRAAFESGKRLRTDKVAILCAVPPDYTADPSVRTDFASFRELTDFWIETVRSVPNVEATFQLHPAMATEHADYVRSRTRVTDENIAALIPGCDFLVTSVSSIIRLSVACRKPVVNYDVYGFDYSDYKDAPGVMHVATRDDFKSAVARLAADDAAYAAAIGALKKRADQWGVIDGQSANRFLKLVDRMAVR